MFFKQKKYSLMFALTSAVIGLALIIYVGALVRYLVNKMSAASTTSLITPTQIATFNIDKAKSLAEK